MKAARVLLLVAFAATAVAEDEAIVSRIPRQRVESHAIAAIGYSKRLHALEIEFRNGAIYRYIDVLPDVYRELLAAQSKARFYDQNIRGHYRSLHVRPHTG
jgi:hypothetical protein